MIDKIKTVKEKTCKGCVFTPDICFNHQAQLISSFGLCLDKGFVYKFKKKSNN